MAHGLTSWIFWQQFWRVHVLKWNKAGFGDSTGKEALHTDLNYQEGSFGEESWPFWGLYCIFTEEESWQFVTVTNCCSLFFFFFADITAHKGQWFLWCDGGCFYSMFNQCFLEDLPIFGVLNTPRFFFFVHQTLTQNSSRVSTMDSGHDPKF